MVDVYLTSSYYYNDSILVKYSILSSKITKKTEVKSVKNFFATPKGRTVPIGNIFEYQCK